jgi:hypothetical protein
MPISKENITKDYKQNKKTIINFYKEYEKQYKKYLPNYLLEEYILGTEFNIDNYIKKLIRDNYLVNLIIEGDIEIGFIIYKSIIKDKLLIIDKFFISEKYNVKGAKGLFFDSIINEYKNKGIKYINIDVLSQYRQDYTFFKRYKSNTYISKMEIKI